MQRRGEESTLSATRNNFQKLHLRFKRYNQSAECIWVMGSRSAFGRVQLSSGFFVLKACFALPTKGCMNCLRRSRVSLTEDDRILKSKGQTLSSDCRQQASKILGDLEETLRKDRLTA